MTQDLRAPMQMREMLYGALLSRALCAAAVMGIPDALATGPRSAEELAEEVDAVPDLLNQLLRTLTAFDVFDRLPDGKYALTPLGATLRADAPGSARPTALLVNGEMGAAWAALLGTVRTGRPGFEAVHGMPLFDYLDLHPTLRETFDQSQACDLQLSLEHIKSAVAPVGRTIVDVGGGDGTLLAYLLTGSPGARGVLLDTEATAARAKDVLAEAGLEERTEVVAGDFFVDVPGGGDLYLLREILHDWDDPQCIAILRACRHAMTPDARLVIIERVATDQDLRDAESRMTALMDLYMMSVLRGEERTLGDFERLLSEAGFACSAVSRSPGQVVVIEAVPQPTRPDS
ncbi:methyltransferase [Streptomyces europaeiscabiei]|uniref:methyltransferase n=1 Tax=Streptomyces europaeiscabiei TaxID=146819 RepID=UPI0029BD44D4|nr:methyltransferase [Streptomyces europaeiscabiei]MDX3612452.1 methyltransferase [Streptomyces europaeiscabiei]